MTLEDTASWTFNSDVGIKYEPCLEYPELMRDVCPSVTCIDDQTGWDINYSFEASEVYDFYDLQVLKEANILTISLRTLDSGGFDSTSDPIGMAIDFRMTAEHIVT